MKVHILGGPGSGKTTLAQEIVALLGVPHNDLDLIGQKNGTDAAAHIDDAFALAGQSGWVTEGIYLVLVDPYLYQADYIVYLDIAWPLAAWRIVYRHISRSLRGTNAYPGFQPLLDFLGYARTYYLNTCPDTAEVVRQCLAEHREMALPPTPAVMRAFLETYHPVSIPPTAAFVRLYLEKYREKVFVVRTRADRRRLLRLLASA